MRSLRRALVALAALGAVMALAADAIILGSDHVADRGAWAAFGTALGGSFLATGLYAWWRRPHNRSGALMVWVAFLWFVSPLSFSDDSAIFTMGLFTGALPIAALVHLVLAFPTGRLESRHHRVLVAAGYVTATLLQLPGVLFRDTTDDAVCDGCPANALLIRADDDVAGLFAGIVDVCAVVLIALVVRELVRRVRRARGPERDVYGPVVRAGAATLAAFALLFAAAGIDGAVATVLQLLAFAAFVSVPYAFLAGLIRGRLSRAGAVAELVESLARADDRRSPLRESIAAALGDSSLTLAYWVPDRRGYVDAEGRRVELPEPGSGRTATLIERGGRPLAAILHDEGLAEERELVRAVGGAAALTLENERLAAELRARIEELRASRARIVRAADEERRRLERDLHDGAQQRLVALALRLRLARDAGDPAETREQLEEAIEELDAATAELRELARGIHPAVLTTRGLDAAVHALAGRSRVPVEVRAVPEERLPAPVESTVYFVVAEALTNVTRYAQASQAEVDIGREDGTLVVEVRDDGVGGADPGRGSGLRGLADRVAAVDGRLVVSSRPGAGTVVHAEIPCAQ